MTTIKTRRYAISAEKRIIMGIEIRIYLRIDIPPISFTSFRRMNATVNNIMVINNNGANKITPANKLNCISVKAPISHNTN